MVQQVREVELVAVRAMCGIDRMIRGAVAVTFRRKKRLYVPFRHDLPVLARQGRSAVVSFALSRFPALRTTQNTSRKVSGKNAASMAIAVARSSRPGVP